jgi:membrane associated rhomboid family serine protease
MYTISVIIIILILIGLVMMWKSDYPAVGILVLTNFAVFFVQFLEFFIDSSNGDYILDLGFKSESLVTGEQPWTIVTNLFVHSGFLHIMGNMLFLTLLGMPFEDRVGKKKFALIYFAGGIGANILNGIAVIQLNGSGSWEAEVIGIGASAAIFGIMGAFAILYPKDEIPMFLVFFFVSRVPVYIVAMLYGLIETAMVEMAPDDNVGHLAHISGFILGVFIGPLVANREARLVQRTDYSELKDLLKAEKNRGLTMAIDNLISTDISEVREVWWEDLLIKVRCPSCDSGSGPDGIGPGGHGLLCNTCGYSLDLRKKKK